MSDRRTTFKDKTISGFSNLFEERPESRARAIGVAEMLRGHESALCFCGCGRPWSTYRDGLFISDRCKHRADAHGRAIQRARFELDATQVVM